MHSARQVHFSEADYLAHEEGSLTRNEFLDGEIYAMAGAKGSHNVIATNTAAALSNLVRAGRRCRVFNSDQRIHVPDTGLYTYPDGGVVCGKWQIHGKDDLSLLNPTLLFEVLSPSTADYDRGLKLDHYRRLPALREVLLIDQPAQRVEHHYRSSDDGGWSTLACSEGAVELHALGGAILVSDIYYLADLAAE